MLSQSAANPTDHLLTGDARPVSVVVPVHGEDPARIIALIASLDDQSDARHVDVHCVVNNDQDDGGAAWRQKFERNQEVLRLPHFHGTRGRDDARIRAYVHDYSSPGSWIEGCTVGHARQRGLEAVTRGLRQSGRDGLVVHTDADCKFEDPTFISRVRWLFRINSDLLALFGEYTPQFDPNDPEAAVLVGRLTEYQMLRRYVALHGDLTRGEVAFYPDKSYGSCIAHRALAGMQSGGFLPVNLGEDVKFGDRLREYARTHGMRIEYGRKWRLGTVTALRLSGRTGNHTVHNTMAMSRKGGHPLVDDAFNPGKKVPLTEEYIDRMCTAVAAMKNGPEHLEFLFVTSALARVARVPAAPRPCGTGRDTTDDATNIPSRAGLPGNALLPSARDQEPVDEFRRPSVTRVPRPRTP